MGLNKKILNKIEKKYFWYQLNKKTEIIKETISEKCINIIKNSKCINALKEDKPLIITKLMINIPILVLIYYLSKHIN